MTYFPFKKPLIWVLLIFAASTWGDAAEPAYQIINQYTKLDGLPVNAIADLDIDDKGYLWLATHDGLVRFDGSKFKIYNSNTHPSMPNNRVFKVIPYEKGLIVALDYYQFFYLSNDEFTPIGQSKIYAYGANSNGFYFATDKGLALWHPDISSASTLFEEIEIRAVLVTEENIYFADKQCDFYTYDIASNSIVSSISLNCAKPFSISQSEDGLLAFNTNQGIWRLTDDLRLIKPSIEYKTSGWHQNELHTSNPIAKGILSAGGKWKEIISDSKTSQLPRYEQYGQWFMNQDFTLLNSGEITFNSPIATHYYTRGAFKIVKKW